MDKSKESQPGNSKNPSGQQQPQGQTPAGQQNQSQQSSQKSPQQPQQQQPQKEQTQRQQQAQHENQPEPGDVPVQEPSDLPVPPITNGNGSDHGNAAAVPSAQAGAAPIVAQSQQPKAADGDAAKWQQQVGAARTTWGKLTEDELVKSGGHEQKLASLVQGRYAISHDEASRQVKKFIASSHAR